jgi:hypothetical protein
MGRIMGVTAQPLSAAQPTHEVVHDDFVREIKKRRPFWVGQELARRVIKGDSPVLTDKR